MVATRGGKRPYQPSLAFVHPFPLGTPKVDSPSQRRQGTAERVQVSADSGLVRGGGGQKQMPGALTLAQEVKNGYLALLGPHVGKVAASLLPSWGPPHNVGQRGHNWLPGPHVGKVVTSPLPSRGPQH